MKNFKEQEFSLCLNYYEETISFYKKIRQEIPIKKTFLNECVHSIKSQKYINVSISDFEDNKKNVLSILKESPNMLFLIPKISTSMILNLGADDLEKVLLFIPVNQLSFDVVKYYLSLFSKLHNMNIHEMNLGVTNYFKQNKLTADQEKIVLEYFSKISFNSSPKMNLKLAQNEYGYLQFSNNFWNELFLQKRHSSGFFDLFKTFPVTDEFKKMCIEKDPIRLIKHFPELITFDVCLEMLEKSKTGSSSFQRELVKKIPLLPQDQSYKLDEAINILSKRKTLLEVL